MAVQKVVQKVCDWVLRLAEWLVVMKVYLMAEKMAGMKVMEKDTKLVDL
jgi:hypothetical protein